MNMKEAVISVLTNWKNFSGRACRSEFWYFQLAYIIVAVIISFIELKFVSDFPISILLGFILDILLLVTSLAVTSRRLQDYGFSGWWQLSYITVIGFFVVFVWCMLPAKEDENQWGKNPLLES